MKALVGILAIGSCFSATAGNIYCEGSVGGLYVTNTGDVVFNGSYHTNYTQVCNLHGSWQGITTETCYAWYSQLLAARTHSQNVLLNYQTTATYTCASLPTYQDSPAPGYVMVKNQ